MIQFWTTSSNGNTSASRLSMVMPAPESQVGADDPTHGSPDQRAQKPPTTSAKPISPRKLAANQRNAQRSTGPRTVEGKRRSSMNALRHGLLAEGVITHGDYKEDAIEYIEFLESLKRDLRPRGPAEEQEVVNIARLYWRQGRAVLAEVGAIEQRTLGMRMRAKRRQKARVKRELKLGPGAVRRLRQHAAGVKHIINVMRAVRADLSAGTPPWRHLKWLITEYPRDFAPNKSQERVMEDGRNGIEWTDAYEQRVRTALDKHLSRLTRSWFKLAEREEQMIEADIKAAALLDDKQVLTLTRYETSIGRQLDRAHKRLDTMRRFRGLVNMKLSALFP